MNPVGIEFKFRPGGRTVKRKQLPGWIPPGTFAKLIKAKVHDFDNPVTVGLTLYDSDGDVVYEKSTLAKNQVSLIFPTGNENIPLVPRSKIQVELSGNPGSGGKVALVLHGSCSHG